MIDKSAWEQSGRNVKAAVFIDEARSRGLAAFCEMAVLEILYSARNLIEWDDLREVLATAYGWLPVTQDAMGRAIEVQGLLAVEGRHRVAPPDLIIAATAELNGATVLHYDKDYDLIAAVTGQPTQWVVPRGTN